MSTPRNNSYATPVAPKLTIHRSTTPPSLPNPATPQNTPTKSGGTFGVTVRPNRNRHYSSASLFTKQTESPGTAVTGSEPSESADATQLKTTTHNHM